MTSAALFAISVALVMIAAALALWAVAVQRASSSSMESFLSRRATATSKLPPAAQRRIAAQTSGRIKGAVDGLLNGCGIKPNRSVYAMLLGPTVLTTLVAGLVAGALAAAVVFALVATATYLFMWLKQQRHQKRMVAQLPALMDAMVRMITIGNSIQSAFQTAIPNVPLPLRSVLEHSSRLMRAGLELDQALFQVARIYRVDELILFAAVMRMSNRYGGRADAVLDRMGNFMRDREEAERELLALSSETRMSAWVLGLLPISIGLLIAVLNANYVANMWFDATGRKLMLGALALQLFGAVALYRLARIK